MVDVFEPSKRSEIMSLIRSKNTVAELIVFKYLRKNKIYFQRHYKKAPGTPDVALPRKKKAVFIDSDFWHGKDFERVKKDRSPDDYWVIKISATIARDKMQRDELTKTGWSVLVVWERDIKRKRTQDRVLKSIKEFLIS